MTEFEEALQECLRDLEQGGSNLDVCLNRYPTHALQLEPVLLAHAKLERLRELRPSAAFKSRARARLTREMQARPRKVRPFHFMFMQLAASLAVIVLVLLVTGTVYAQGALPGDALYGWKLASEKAWRTASPDPVGADLAIADRRVDELLVIGKDPMLYTQTLKAYQEVTDRLKSEMDTENEARILPVLDSQIEELNNSGILVPEPDQDVSPQLDVLPSPSLTAIATPSATEAPEIEIEPTLVVPEASSLPIQDQEPLPLNQTDLPQIVPSVEIPPVEVPTVELPTLLP